MLTEKQKIVLDYVQLSYYNKIYKWVDSNQQFAEAVKNDFMLLKLELARFELFLQSLQIGGYENPMTLEFSFKNHKANLELALFGSNILHAVIDMALANIHNITNAIFIISKDYPELWQPKE